MENREISTEAVTLEDVTAAAERLKETDANVIREWLESLLPGILGFAIQVLLAVIVYFIGTKIIKLVRKILNRWLDKAEADTGAKQFLDALVKYVMYFILVVIILTFFGVTTASVIAVVGSAGVTIGLALQGSLSNFAGGVLILLLKPFKVGDYIKEDTYNNEGTVSEISIFYTKLLSVDNKTIIIPNGTLANSSLTNATNSANRRVDLEAGIAYEANLKQAKQILRRLAEEEKLRLPEEEISVFVSELGASEVKLGMRLWVKNENYWEVKWRLTEQIKLAFDEAGIEIPYQKIDVNYIQK